MAASASTSAAGPSSFGALLLPGQPVPASGSSGAGTYRRGSYLLSSVVGRARAQTSGGVQGHTSGFIIPSPGSVVLGRITRVTPRQASVSVLVVDGQPVSAGASNGGAMSAGDANRAAGEDPGGADFTGVIRQQDVRATEKDKVKLAECFRPGDIVRAQVISLGDARSYYLSTASNNLGVIYALPAVPYSEDIDDEVDTLVTSHRGTIPPLEPVSWIEMRDPRTGVIEKRKVAKPEGV
ncbi:Exosomal 3'-5' exoribonuclease complex, subunit ski4 (Csl4) [Ceraceosorus bombacis]|uniref:Exosomal 3'-5' exoribonuclease complex, subunit ski4 (Csl4) n=1 Tax=Ceraceosorus bombacis TaxID=401625 RepID=A0A0P1BHS1_9BASI|nr:Exosomal 3'-5' exoribonuclease complex, subunit ski4 (Csl4) [Ceraceosorus bombacis]